MTKKVLEFLADENTKKSVEKVKLGKFVMESENFVRKWGEI